MTDEYALLIAFVEHAESGLADYELAFDVEHVDNKNGVYRTGCAVYLDGELKFVIDKADVSTWLISPARLKPFGDNYLRNEYRKIFRLEDEPME